jgi:flavin reductase (DIM6/NTAB) family NADH-FMN oxidoreductase RutF
MPDTKITADPASHAAIDSYKLLVGSIVPRPIAFVSTISPEGVTNLAPFSFFNAICADPPTVCFSVANRTPSKDTVANIRATGEFVVNIVSEAIAEQMNRCAGDYPAGVSEFDMSRLTPDASGLVKPPCVRESPMNMECKLIQIVDCGTRAGGASLVIGEVVRFHFARGLVDNFRVDPAKLSAVGRMGGNQYIHTTDRFEMIRPKV